MLGRTSIGLAVERERKKRRWSMGELARQSGLTSGYISKVEAGEVRSPGIEQVQKLADAFGVSTSHLLGISLESLAMGQVEPRAAASQLSEAILPAVARLFAELRVTRADLTLITEFLNLLSDAVRQVAEEAMVAETTKREALRRAIVARDLGAGDSESAPGEGEAAMVPVITDEQLAGLFDAFPDDFKLVVKAILSRGPAMTERVMGPGEEPTAAAQAAGPETRPKAISREASLRLQATSDLLDVYRRLPPDQRRQFDEAARELRGP